MKNAHEAIIEESSFNAAQEEIKHRSNVEIDVTGEKKRKSTHYSTKENNTFYRKE